MYVLLDALEAPMRRQRESGERIWNLGSRGNASNSMDLKTYTWTFDMMHPCSSIGIT
jgi:hypothetical protein